MADQRDLHDIELRSATLALISPPAPLNQLELSHEETLSRRPRSALTFRSGRRGVFTGGSARIGQLRNTPSLGLQKPSSFTYQR
jgi:hypothetical protein